MSSTTAFRINGEERSLSSATLLAALAELGYDTDRRGIAAAVNGTLVPRTAWANRRLEAGDEIEIVAAVQGG